MVTPDCVSCGASMLTHRTWTRASAEQRAGYVRAGAHGLCLRCYSRARHHGTLPQPAPAGEPRATVDGGARGRRRRLTDDEVTRLRRMVGVA